MHLLQKRFHYILKNIQAFQTIFCCSILNIYQKTTNHMLQKYTHKFFFITCKYTIPKPRLKITTLPWKSNCVEILHIIFYYLVNYHRRLLVQIVHPSLSLSIISIICSTQSQRAVGGKMTAFQRLARDKMLTQHIHQTADVLDGHIKTRWI